jgi:hypothetical protein
MLYGPYLPVACGSSLRIPGAPAAARRRAFGCSLGERPPFGAMVAAAPSTSQLRDSFRPGPLSLPQALTDALRHSPEQFAQLCRANPESVLDCRR